MSRHKPPCVPMCLLAVFITACCAATAGSMTSDEDAWISTMVEYMEIEYEDQCSQISEAELSLLQGNKNALDVKLDAKKTFGDFAKNQATELQTVNAGSIKRKWDLISKPGDTMLKTDQWNSLVSFSELGMHEIESFQSYDCRQDLPQSCSYSMLLSTIANSRDRHLLTSAKTSWENKLPDEEKFESDILPLARNASIANGFTSVEKYWEMLSEYPNGYKKVQELWEELEPLYDHLHKYLGHKLEKLNGSLKDDGSIPAQWLGSLLGDDWSNIIDIALPNEEVFQEIDKNMQKKFIAGRNAYKQASTLLYRLGLDPLKSTFWRDSKFDGACPTKLIHSCNQATAVYVFTCQNRSLPMLLDAHDRIMTAKHMEIKSQQRANTYIIKEANRFSALDVALSELGSLLLLNPQQLDAEEVLPLKTSERLNIKDPLLLVAALRDLPRLAYYMAADTWRLKLLEQPGPIHIGKSWAQTRRNLSKVSPSDNDFMGDFKILTNTPYLSNFMGIVLKYQLFNYLTDEIYEDNVDIVSHIAKGPGKLKELMSKGYSEEWPEVLSKSLKIFDVSADSMLEYFRPLKDFLYSQDPESKPPASEDDEDANYEDEEEEEAEKSEDAENTENNEEVKETEVEEPAVLKEDISEVEQKVVEKAKENVHKEVNNNLDAAVVTENYDDNPHLVPKDEGSPAASSSDITNRESDTSQAPQQSQMPYVWIALGVIILIIVILAVVIGRKRYKHKKELERERREGAA